LENVPQSNLANAIEEQMSKRIVGACQALNFNLDSSFKIFDDDRDGYISYNDFQFTIYNILKLKDYTKEELDLLWGRLQPKNGKLSQQDFNGRFATYFSADDQMSFTRNKFMDVSYGDRRYEEQTASPYRTQLSQVNRMLETNTQNLQATVQSDFFQSLVTKLANYIRKNNYTYNIDNLLESFDTNNDKHVNPVELKSVFMSLGERDITAREVDSVMTSLDLNNDGKVSVQELKSALKSRIVNEIRVQEVEESETKSLLDRLNKFLMDYMQSKNKGISETFREMDSNRDGSLNFGEIIDFFRNKLKLNLDERETRLFLHRIDKNGDNLIDFVEFSDELKRHMVDRQVIFQRLDTTIQNLLAPLAKHMNDSKATDYQVFNEMDEGKGLVNRDQLSLLLRKYKIPTNEQELNIIFDYFDKAKKGKFNFQSFADGIKMVQSKLAQDSNRYDVAFPYVLEELRLKVRAILQHADNAKQLDTMFAMYHQSASDLTISKENFRHVMVNMAATLSGGIALQDNEVDLLLNSDLVDKKGGNIEYKKFIMKHRMKDTGESKVDLLSSGGIYQSQVFDGSVGSGTGGAKPHISQLKKSQTVGGNSIFKSIANVMKTNHGMTKEKIFSIFAKHDKKKITKKDFLDAFKDMSLKFTAKEVDDLFNYCDKDNSGSVDYAEFVAALNKNWS
jgi:Ca2+-binding EF-hand superfamily protein